MSDEQNRQSSQRRGRPPAAAGAAAGERKWSDAIPIILIAIVGLGMAFGVMKWLTRTTGEDETAEPTTVEDIGDDGLTELMSGEGEEEWDVEVDIDVSNQEIYGDATGRWGFGDYDGSNDLTRGDLLDEIDGSDGAPEGPDARADTATTTTTAPPSDKPTTTTAPTTTIPDATTSVVEGIDLLWGRVVDSLGRPIPNFDVQLHVDDDGDGTLDRWLSSGVTNNNGWYHMTPPGKGCYAVLLELVEGQTATLGDRRMVCTETGASVHIADLVLG